MDKAYLTKNIAHCNERIDLMEMRIKKAKRSNGFDQGDTLKNLEERIKGLGEALKGFEDELSE